ncbi:MAG: HAD-IIIC family phosphatase [Gammaproteobacteria bacterium]
MDIKLIIWDLDDTLWQGTLAEDEAICLNEYRAELIRAYNRCGLVSAICSKNDYEAAKSALMRFNLWDEFVFPRIAFVSKGDVIRTLIDDMQLRPINVLFIDDNIHNRQEVKAILPDIHVMDALSPDCDKLLQKILEANQHMVKNRLDDYRMLQARVEDRQVSTAQNEEFLASCDIHIAFGRTLENLEFKDRIAELINRSNQLNYTQSRTTTEALVSRMIDINHYDSYTVFMWDKYGYHGLVGFAMVDVSERPGTIILKDLAFSCRVMHMGVEQALLRKIQKHYVALRLTELRLSLPDLSGSWLKEEKFIDPQIRNMIRKKESVSDKQAARLKVMYGCMSGGLAYYSRYRDEIEFDGARFEQHNQFLCFSTIRTQADEIAKQSFPPALVYGAAFDYYDAAWSVSERPVTVRYFTESAHAFCQYFAEKNCRLLVVLPPDTMPTHYYRLAENNTKERTAIFNRTWRLMAKLFPLVTILDLSSLATVDDMPDTAHYYPQFIQKIAGYIDDWYEEMVVAAI